MRLSVMQIYEPVINPFYFKCIQYTNNAIEDVDI